MNYILVTGASMGIGRALVTDFARKGSNLLLVARSRDRLEALQDELKRFCTGDVRVLVEDLSQQESPSRIFQFCIDHRIDVDCLVNCAGFSHAGDFAVIPDMELQQMMAVNMMSMAALTRRFLPEMLMRGHGTIINVASLGGFQGVPSLGLYSATKSFVITFTEALHDEVKKRGVRVFAVCPGFIDTDFYDRAGHDRSKIILPISHTSVVVNAVTRGMRSGRIRIFPTALDWLLVFSQRLLPRIAVIRTAAFFAGANGDA